MNMWHIHGYTPIISAVGLFSTFSLGCNPKYNLQWDLKGIEGLEHAGKVSFFIGKTSSIKLNGPSGY